jgi:YidC/Oxa1 family membrane protein insertase
METRLIIFLILALAIIIGYPYLLEQLGYAPTQPPQEQGQPAKPAEPLTGAAPAPTSKSKPDAVAASPLTPSGDRSSERPADSAHAQRPPIAEERVEVTTDLYRATFTTRGAEVTSWELIRYTMPGQDGPKPVQLVHQEGKFRGPLSLQLSDAALTTVLTQGLYRVERDFTSLDAAHPTGHLRFRWASADGAVRIEKAFTFHHGSYLMEVEVRTEGLSGDLDLGLGTNFGIVEWGQGFIGLVGPALMVDDQLVKESPDTEIERKGAIRWAGLQDKYFLAVLLPTQASAVLLKNEGPQLVSARLRAPVPAAGSALTFQLFAGPKEFDTLRDLNVGLEETIDFGWFIYDSFSLVRAVAKPLFSVLRFLYEYTHNYGVTIILLTVAIKLLFVPLQYKSYKSMKQMQVIQPKVLELQKKHTDDRERLNRELLKLYRDHKVNPVGGCLPMLLQMPVFVALFNILYMTIDLRQAPFVLWVTDLSAADPYYVLPVLMGASMVVQQKIMPTTMDPTQAKVMLVLPALMTLLFLNFPAGLVLYWLTNNVLTIGQQVITDQYIFKQPAAAVAESTPGDRDARPGKKKKDKAEQPSETDTPIEA